MTIERISESEYAEVSAMVTRALANSAFAVFYPRCSVDYVTGDMDVDGVRDRDRRLHFYVAKEDGRVVGCGGIGALDGSPMESETDAIYVDPDSQGRGVGRKIIETLERDEYGLRARRIEISAAISAIPFCRKLGYKHKNDELIYNDGQILLEKFL